MFDGETAPWLAKESLPILVPVPGTYASLHCSRDGLCVATIGEGKSNAATSVTAILDDPRLDLHRGYFLTAGIAGTPPSVGTLGFAAWARWLIDWDLGHHLLPDSAPQVPHGYLPGQDVGTNVYQLNGPLVDMAYQLTKNLQLHDSPDAVAARGHYPGQTGKKPYVAVCDTVTGDDYWTGRTLSETAQYITDLRTHGQGHYCTTQQEDNATATALARHGYLDRYLSLRTASDFDEPSPGQNVTDLLATFPGYQPAVDNEYLVGSTVAHHLLTHGFR
jgi:purine nucleoside permease